MNCKIYENTECILDNITEENFCAYCCSDCIMHVAVEHDEMLEKGEISE